MPPRFFEGVKIMGLVKFISGDGVEHEVEEDSLAAGVMRDNGFQQIGGSDQPSAASTQLSAPEMAKFELADGTEKEVEIGSEEFETLINDPEVKRIYSDDEVAAQTAADKKAAAKKAPAKKVPAKKAPAKKK